RGMLRSTQIPHKRKFGKPISGATPSLCCMQAPPSRLTSIPSWLVLMGLLTALGPLAIDMYLPAFPEIVRGLGTSQGQVERTLPFYLVGLAAAQVFYGPFADRYGRKKPLLFGLILFTIASVGCSLTTSIEQLSFW